jgi:hypothetical protein
VWLWRVGHADSFKYLGHLFCEKGKSAKVTQLYACFAILMGWKKWVYLVLWKNVCVMLGSFPALCTSENVCVMLGSFPALYTSENVCVLLDIFPVLYISECACNVRFLPALYTSERRVKIVMVLYENKICPYDPRIWKLFYRMLFETFGGFTTSNFLWQMELLNMQINRRVTSRNKKKHTAN